MALNLDTLASKIYGSNWMITPSAYSSLVSSIQILQAQPKLTITPINSEFKIEDTKESNEGNIALINVNGILMKGCSQEDEEELGLNNIDTLSQLLDDAANDTTISEIVLCFDSPGGETGGIEELGRKIASIDEIKPVYGWSETACASAAYWLMSQCRSIGITPSTAIGSIGVYAIITDNSKALQMSGINKQAIFSGKYKLLGCDFKPLSKEEKEILQTDITEQHNKFKQAILSKRTVDLSYMEGLSYEGKAALEGNLVDVVVDSFDQFLNSTNNYTIDMNKSTKISKPQAQAIVVVKQAEAVDKKEADVVPGVPEDKKASDTQQADQKVGEKEYPKTYEEGSPYNKGYVACPSCNHSWKLEEKHVKNMEEVDVKDVTKEKPTDEPKEDKAPEKKDDLEADKDEQVKPEEDVKKEEELKQDEPEKEEVKKKASMPSLDEWQGNFGIKKQENSFIKATEDFLNSFKF